MYLFVDFWANLVVSNCYFATAFGSIPDVYLNYATVYRVAVKFSTLYFI